MQEQDSTIKQRLVKPEVAEQVQHQGKSMRHQLYSEKPCGELAKNLTDLTFYIQDSRLTINPTGLLYQVPALANSSGLMDAETNSTDIVQESSPTDLANADGSECRIGIESIPAEANHYRLGTTFLKHFYTALDYERNLIVMGLNGHGHANNMTIMHDPEGKKGNKPKKDNYQTLVTLLVFTMIVAFVAMCCYSIAKRRETEPGYLPPLLKS